MRQEEGEARKRRRRVKMLGVVGRGRDDVEGRDERRVRGRERG